MSWSRAVIGGWVMQAAWNSPSSPQCHSGALGRRWPAATKDLADDLSRAGTGDAEAGTNEIGPDVSAIQTGASAPIDKRSVPREVDQESRPRRDCGGGAHGIYRSGHRFGDPAVHGLRRDLHR